MTSSMPESSPRTGRATAARVLESEESAMSPEQSGLHDLYVDLLKDTYSAEKQLSAALPKLAKAAEDDGLADAFRSHLEETKGHLDRLEGLFASLGLAARGKLCEGMKGLIKEGGEAIEDHEKGPVRDAALIAAAQKCEHYELAAYGTMRAFAARLGREEDVGILTATLEEESACDTKLTEIAMRGVNPAAMSERGEG